jgi:hypothetical protein
LTIFAEGLEKRTAGPSASVGMTTKKQGRTRFARFPHLPKPGRAFALAQARMNPCPFKADSLARINPFPFKADSSARINP